MPRVRHYPRSMDPTTCYSIPSYPDSFTDQWKAVFLENRASAFQIWREPFTELRIPLLFNLRRDPFEKAQIDANVYHDWFLDRAFVLVPMQQLAGKFFQTLAEYPPSQTPGSFNLEKVQEQIRNAASGK